ncbi:antitoxin [Castellaniella hirudinis]|uniref:Antitoxin n=1 Tax=Castellaniella hirudinis TaxID=1144617 RepID=A0ABV8S317_9BURK
MQTAKLFINGRSQAVRLPAEFRFEGSEVFIRRDPLTGDVILSSRSGWTSWDEFLAQRDLDAVPADFLADRRQPPQQTRSWAVAEPTKDAT